jgi:hypothetical protein
MGDMSKPQDSLYALSYESEEDDKEKIEVLKTIVNWVASKIPYEKQDVLPKSNWLHFLPVELYLEYKIAGLTFEGIRTIGGIDGPELLVQTKCVLQQEEYNEILFPILDTNSWDGLNLKQCFLISYATCLYHDICIEGKYEMHESSQKLPDGEPFYILDVGNVFYEDGVLREHPLKRFTHKSSKPTSKKSKQTTKEEHWVSFHFRKLKDNWNASEEAKNNAKKYGIKELPNGYTFVDAHIKGENKDSIPKISAIDVISKTFGKMINIEKQEVR